VTRILVVASQREMRERIAASLKDIDRPLAAVALRKDVVRMLDNIRQVLVYAAHEGGDAGWIANQMEEHSELRVVYLSQNPWASLNYDRARCMIAPINPASLNSTLLHRMVLDLLAPVSQAVAHR